MEKDRLIIIDGNSLVNRAFYALPPMNTKEGTPTNAVFGFVKMLVGLVEKYKPTHLAVAFDLPKPTFRHKRYDGYKATRKSMPDDLRVQMPLLKNILSKMHIQILEQEGYEADDILGTVAKRFEGHTFVVTGDGDSLQLISDTTTVLVTKKGISELLELTPQNMVEQKGMTPAQVIDYKALCGDTSDNIPGVKGIGEKTATGLLQEYHTLDGVYKNLESIKGSTKDKLVQGKEMAYLSYELATIDTNVPMETPKDACVLVFPFGAGVRAEFENLGFKTLLKMERIFAPSEGVMESQKCAAVVCQHAQIKDQEGLQQVVRSLGDKVGVHIETNTVHLSDGSTEYTMAISDDLFGSLSLATVMGCLKETLENPQQQIIGYDCKQLMREADKYGVGVTAYFDVRLAEYILDYPLSQNECANYFESLGTGEDCLATACVARAQEQTVMLQKAGQDKLFFEIELPLVQVLFAMEKTGMRVDTGVLSNLGKQYSQKLLELSAAVQKLAGQEFNLNSPKQLGKVLFEDMKLPYPFKNSKTLSTAVDVLSEVQDESGIIDLILQYREIAKLNSTYIEGLLRLATDGVVHSDFRQMATVTGRLSSTEPNLQNIPIRKKEGKEIRKAFVASEGRVLVSADYSQIELRLMAHLSGDERMVEAFAKGEDIHTATASEVFGKDTAEVTSEERRAAKAVNFGIIYGISDFGLAKDLGVHPKQAKDYIAKYFARYPKIKQFMEECVQKAYQYGKVSTLFGRVRFIPELKSSNRQIKNFGERTAMNMPMQGSASDIVKIAMNRVYQAIQGTHTKLVLQVHDELVLECDEQDAQSVAKLLQECMEQAVSLSVPLTVDVEIAKSWA